MGSKYVKVRGELLAWARREQDLTMREVADRGGPSLGYQSEVENSKKEYVRPGVLTPWSKAIHVTPEFAQGLIPRYTGNSSKLRGIAADVGQNLMQGLGPDWPATLSPTERARQILRLVSRDSLRCPRVVLAYVLGLSVVTMDEILMGGVPLNEEYVPITMDLTGLPADFFTPASGLNQETCKAVGPYAATLRLAERMQAEPDELEDLILVFLPLPRMGRKQGMNIKDLQTLAQFSCRPSGVGSA